MSAPTTLQEALDIIDAKDSIFRAAMASHEEQWLYRQAAENALRAAGLPIPRPDVVAVARAILSAGERQSDEREIQAEADSLKAIWAMLDAHPVKL